MTRRPRLASALERANNDLQTATLWLMQNGIANPYNAGAAAYHMNLMGVVCLGLMWLRMAGRAAPECRRAGNAPSTRTSCHRPLRRADHARATPPRKTKRRRKHHGAARGRFFEWLRPILLPS
jgi:hypothetical protein